MEILWLQDFLVVAEAGNFTRAAAMRNTSQAEDRPRDEFFGNPRSERVQLFFSKILSH